LAAAVDLALVLQDLYGIAARVKWPNDVMVDGRKIAGILAIMEAETDRIHFVNLGIGINVNHSPALADQPVTSISRITGRPVSRSQLLSAFLDAFESRIQRRGLTGIIDQWRRLSFTMGKQVKIQTPAGLLEGLAVDIEPDGALIIQTADGTRRPVIYGDCLHR
jgi:BirA family biotin operon repressor/biotin-[acetyl-CoA-carboxylase] ligase